MAYVVKKPFDAAGKRWKIGEIMPDGAVQSATLVRAGFVTRIDSGLIDIAGDAVVPQELVQDDGQITLPIITKDGTMVLSVAHAVICDALRMIQSPANEVIEEIQGVRDEDLLIILDACDQRKNVHAAVRKQVEALREDNETEADGSEGDV